MSKTEWPRNKHCRRCPLGPSQKTWGRNTVCVPSRLWRPAGPHATTVLVVIGKAPGREEVEQDKAFVGVSGQILNDWLTALRLAPHIDVVLTNTVRCRLFRDDAPLLKAQTTPCAHWLTQDLAALAARYKKVVVLILGSAASQAHGLGPLKSAFTRQGEDLSFTHKFPVYTQSKRPRVLKTGG